MNADSHEGGADAKSLQKGHRGWGFAVVTGESMRPTLNPGDKLLIRYRRAVRAGDLVVARFADGTVAIKRAVEPRRTRSGEPGWWLLSDNPAVGVDSRHRGPVPADQVWAVALARVWPRPRRLKTSGVS